MIQNRMMRNKMTPSRMTLKYTQQNDTNAQEK